jgi:hypothetical protein
VTSATALPCPDSGSLLTPSAFHVPAVVVLLDGTIEVHLPPRNINYPWLLDALNLGLWHPDVRSSEDSEAWCVARRHLRTILWAVAGEFGPFTLGFSSPGEGTAYFSWEDRMSGIGPLLGE